MCRLVNLEVRVGLPIDLVGHEFKNIFWCEIQQLLVAESVGFWIVCPVHKVHAVA